MPPPLCFGDAREGTYHPELVEGPLPHPGKSIQGELHPPDQTSSSQLTPTLKILVDRIGILSSMKHSRVGPGVIDAMVMFGTKPRRSPIWIEFPEQLVHPSHAS